MTESARLLRPGAYAWHVRKLPSGHLIDQQPVRIAQFLQIGGSSVLVESLAQHEQYVAAVADLVYAVPSETSDLRTSAGRRLPDSLQSGGQTWFAVADALRSVHGSYRWGEVNALLITLTERGVISLPAGSNGEDSNTPTGPPAASATSRQAVLGTVPTIPPVQL